MTDLKTCFEDLGFDDVRTFLQTGNVTFSAAQSGKTLIPQIEAALSERFHYTAYVQIYPLKMLQQIIADYPFAADEQYHRYVAFVADAAVIAQISNEAAQCEWVDEEIKAAPTVIYWRVPKGKTIDSTFGKISAKPAYKKSLTTRNLNTLQKMAAAS